MPFTQKIFALFICLLVFTVTLALVRQRRLREEYSLLWLANTLVIFVLVWRYDWLEKVTEIIGAALPTTTLFIGSLVFLVLIAVQFSMKLSRLSDQVKNLAQENAMLRADIARAVPGEERDAAP